MLLNFSIFSIGFTIHHTFITHFYEFFQVQSPIVAKMHYSGQKHMKQIKRFLLEWSLRTGHDMPKVEEPIISATPVRIQYFNNKLIISRNSFDFNMFIVQCFCHISAIQSAFIN